MGFLVNKIKYRRHLIPSAGDGAASTTIRGESMDRVKMPAHGIKRVQVESYMDELVEAGRLAEDEIFLWPYHDLKKERPRWL